MASVLHQLNFLKLLLLLLLLLPIFTFAQNITLGSSLTADTNNNASWRSPSGDFAFGFRPLENNLFLLSIWYDKIPDKTLVWYPYSSASLPIAAIGSKIEVTTAGNLLLTDPQGKKLWEPESITGSVAYAAMLDNGNFVLSSGSGNVNSWESFKYPADTILPLPNGRLDSDVNGNALIKVRKDGPPGNLISPTLTLGTSLTADTNNNASWKSPSGDFAFGFRLLENNIFLLSIWYDKIPDKTVVWYADSNESVPIGSKVELTTAGKFLLTNTQGEILWEPESMTDPAKFAAMLDSGNFVLTSDSGNVKFDYLWESFKYPRDTILPPTIDASMLLK